MAVAGARSSRKKGCAGWWLTRRAEEEQRPGRSAVIGRLAEPFSRSMVQFHGTGAEMHIYDASPIPHSLSGRHARMHAEQRVAFGARFWVLLRLRLCRLE